MTSLRSSLKTRKLPLVILMALAPVFLQAASCVSTRSADKPRIDPPPAELVADCALAVKLPERVLTAAEVEKYWGQDRASLRVCRERQSGLIRFITVRDAALTGAKK